MKKGLAFFLCALLALSLTGCAQQEEPAPPDLKTVQKIAKLSTLKVRFHGVYTFSQEKYEPGIIFGWFSKDLNFWLEYEGLAQYGINAEKIKMIIDQNGTVHIALPEVEVLNVQLDQQTMDEKDEIFYLAKDSANLNAEQQALAISEAKNKLLEDAQANESYKQQALERAQLLIENYIHKLGDAAGVEYNVVFE